MSRFDSERESERERERERERDREREREREGGREREYEICEKNIIFQSINNPKMLFEFFSNVYL